MIDRIDEQIVELLTERSMISREISILKLVAGMPIEDHGREADVLGHARQKARGRVSDEAVERIYGAILAESRRVQREVLSEVSRDGAVQ